MSSAPASDLTLFARRLAAPARCAIYARYSSDMQRESSIADQIRECRGYAASKGWTIAEEHIYFDEAVTATARDRDGFQALLAQATLPRPPFTYILLDSTSRVARDVVISLETCRRLKFNGVHLYFLAQNIDTATPDAEMLLTFHGIIDSQHLKKLAHDTHRGMRGAAQRGWATGGKTYGLETFPIFGGKVDHHGTPIPEGYDLKKMQDEAKVVGRVFRMFADGLGYRKIAFALNADAVPYPRLGDRNDGGGWSHTTIRAILRNERYTGRLVWNRSKWEKVPGEKKRRCTPRPREEWTTVERPELAIIDQDLWDRVQARIKVVEGAYGKRVEGRLEAARPNRAAAASRYLLSGLLRCGVCGGNIIVTGGNKNGKDGRRYGCSRHFNMGPKVCANNLTIRTVVLDALILEEVRERLATPKKLEEAADMLREELAAARRDLPDREATVRSALAKVQRKVDNFLRAIGDGVDARSLREALAAAEAERDRLRAEMDKLLGAPKPADVILHPSSVNRLIENLRENLGLDVAAAREALRSYLGAITLTPTEVDGRKAYIAEGALDASEALHAAGRRRGSWSRTGLCDGRSGGEI